MNFTTLFIGALTLKHQTFVTLRERSDVFWRGFLVLLIAALIAGLFSSIQAALHVASPPQDKEQAIALAIANFRSSYTGPAAMSDTIETYISEGIALGYDIQNLPPRAGEGARPVVALVDYVGNVLATPFRFGWMGWTLLAGLLFQLTSRLFGGRASMAQMLGLSSLAAAPQVFSLLTSLLALTGALSGIGSLLGFVIAVWSAAVYVKATAVAQNFSIGRALGAIVVGLGILLGVVIVLGVIVAVVVAGVIGSMRG